MHDQAAKLRNRLSGNRSLAKTIAIVSGKGGVGKSNTVLNFSLALQEQGRKVLIFDLDIGMGNIHILLGRSTDHTIVDLFNKYVPINDMIERGPKDLSFIAGGSSLNDLVHVGQAQLNYFFEQYERLQDDYDYIFFDMGAGVSETSLPFILAADECIVVTTPEPTAITDAYSMVKHIFHRAPEMPVHVILNRSIHHKEGERTLSRFVFAVRQFLQQQVTPLGLLPNDPVVTEAVIRQTPYLLYRKHAPISKAIYQMASQFESDGIAVRQKHAPAFLLKLKHFLKVGRTE